MSFFISFEPRQTGFLYPIPLENNLQTEFDRKKKAHEVCTSHLSQTIAERDVAIKSLKREVKQLKAKLAEQTELLEAERAKNKTLENSLHHHFSECKEGSSASFSGHYKLSQQQKMAE